MYMFMYIFIYFLLLQVYYHSGILRICSFPRHGGHGRGTLFTWNIDINMDVDTDTDVGMDIDMACI
jgi:hypothetical protein